MGFSINSGVWPTMITLFDQNNKIDFPAMKRLIDWYIEKDVNGLFAVCQSSEMFFMSKEERVLLAKFIKENAPNLQVIASGHISRNLDDQIDEIKAISETGIDAFVLVSNRLAEENESEDVVKKNIETILSKVPNVNFGIYECPYPYKRLISPSLLGWLAETGRFYFLKDTSCDLEQIKQKVEAVKGTQLKIFNANSTTLLDSLKIGAYGYSGVMANFHPELYSWLNNNWRNSNEFKINELQSFLSMASLYELKSYPINAKYFMKLEGISNSLQTRTVPQIKFDELHKIEVQNLKVMTDLFKEIVAAR